MSLTTILSDLATNMATQVKGTKTLLNGNVSDLSALTTTAKSNLVLAINEVKAEVQSAAQSGGATINDASSASTTQTYSVTKIVNLLSGKEGSVATGTTGQYYRGDKSWQTLNKAAVGLANVDNTSDAAKPISTATQTALDAKQPLDAILTGTTASFTTALNTKLSGIATGATANSTDAVLLSRANHTGTQALTTTTFANTSRIAGRATAGAGAAEELTAAQVKTILALVKADVGLGNVDNTSDANKPISTATQTALNTKASINDAASSSLTETWSITKIAAQIANLVASAPGTLDTLDELAAALGDDPNFATTMATSLGNRVRVDASQTFTGPQMLQARTNIGAVAAVDVGNTEIDLVAVFNAGLV